MNIKKYHYGVSFNCEIGNDSIGGGSEGYSSLDYVGNNLDVIREVLLDENEDYHFTTEHELVRSQELDFGGEVIEVMVDDEDYVLCVIFENPDVMIVE